MVQFKSVTMPTRQKLAPHERACEMNSPPCKNKKLGPAWCGGVGGDMGEAGGSGLNWERVDTRPARRDRPGPRDDFVTQTMGMPKGKADSKSWAGLAGRETRNSEHATH